MFSIRKNFRSGYAASALMLFSTLLNAAPTNTQRIIVPGRTIIPVTLDQKLSSKDSHKGDTFTATVHTDGNYSDFPEGTKFQGVIKSVVQPSKNAPGSLDVNFVRAILPDNQRVAVLGSLSSLDNKSIKRTSSGRIISSGRKNDTTKFIAYGAAGGLVIGLLTKKTLEGTLIGAAAGYLYGQTQRNKSGYKDVVVAKDTKFGVMLDKQVAYRLNTQRYPVGNLSTTGYNPNEYNSGSMGSSTNIGLFLDDSEIGVGDNAPYQLNGTVMVPLKNVLNAMSVPFTYNSPRKLLTVQGANETSKLTINSRSANIGGSTTRLMAPAQEKNGTIYVPIQFISLATGMSVHWDQSKNTVVFTNSVQ